MAELLEVSKRNGDEGGISIDLHDDDCIEELFLRMKMKKEMIISRVIFTFFRVPKPLLYSCRDCYIPDLVSIGPHHFANRNLRLEVHKAEAMRRMEFRIQLRSPERTLQSIVEKDIMQMEKGIRDCYEEGIPYTSKQLAWMLTGDACFIYEFILSYCRKVQFMDAEEQWMSAAKYDSIFDSCGMNPLWKRILFNLLLFENQIPFSVLELLVQIAMGSKEILEEKLYNKWLASLISGRSVGVFSWSVSPPSMRGQNPHLLGAFYHAMVGSTDLYRNDLHRRDKIPKVTWCEYFLISKLRHLVLRLLQHLLWRPSVDEDFVAGDKFKDILLPKLPSARELKEKGVKFRCIRPKKHSPPIQCVRFNGKTATLSLPQVHVDSLRIALIRNFIAMEVTNDMYAPYPMTSFAILMNELVDNAEDCRLLSEARIIVPLLGNDAEVAKVFNSIMHGTEMRSQTCKSIDNVRAGLHKYLNRRRRRWWNEIYSIYLSGPWKIVALIAATVLLLLIMSVIQVFCIFHDCYRS